MIALASVVGVGIVYLVLTKEPASTVKEKPGPEWDNESWESQRG